MTYPSIIIPLEHYDTTKPVEKGRWYYMAYHRSFMSNRLYQIFLDKVGRGIQGACQTEAEVTRYLDHTYFTWAWVPCGDIAPEVPSGQQNDKTHMKIFFRDKSKALLMRLSL